MRISDWSSDVCSSDLFVVRLGFVGIHEAVLVGVDLVEHPGLVGVRGVELGARDLAVLVRIHRGNAALAFLRLVGAAGSFLGLVGGARSEEHTSELQSLMRISYAVFWLHKQKNHT